MCSSGNCDMAGLIAGPVGNIVGIGIKALVSGAAIGPRTAEALKKPPTEQEKIQQFYDNVEAHLKGALQVLQPALEIKNALCSESRSADRERPAIRCQPAIQYYSPQNLKKSQENVCPNRCCGSKRLASRLTEKSSWKTPSPKSSRNYLSTEKNSPKRLSTSSKCCSKSKKDISTTKCCSTRVNETSLKSSCKPESKEKSSKSSSKAKSKRSKSCCICDVSLKENIVLAVLPCEHLFCYTCLGEGSGKRCRKCDKSYDMKNVQQEVRLCFEQLTKVLQTRERQLLRQVQAVQNQQLSIVQSNWEHPPSIPSIRVNLSQQRDLEETISKFGELVSSDRNSIIVSDVEPYKIEEYVEADKDHISFDKSIKVDGATETRGAERLENFEESAGELSFNTSSEADVTLENEITVLMNHNYLSPSSSPQQKSQSEEQTRAEAEHKTENIEQNIHSEGSSSDTRDNLLNGSYKSELEVFDEATIDKEDCTVPEKQDPRATEDYFAKENTSGTENNDSYCSTDSGSPTEALEKSTETLISKKTQECDQHPKQIQQWLQQILVETETEPTIHEVEQFAEISKSRFKEFQFPLET